MKILSWNVNGIRAAFKKGFAQWLATENPDIACIQETKAHQDQLDQSILHPHSYQSVWFSAQRRGYSSVGVYFKKDPLDIIYGMGQSAYDDEGRVVQLIYSDFVLINAYFPNSQQEGARLPYKLGFCKAILNLCQYYRQSGKNIILAGDYNIAHRPIDLKRPDENESSAGFLPKERAWMDEFLGCGFVDGFRKFEQGPNHYTWWTYRANARARNIGWRIDYMCVNPEFADRLKLVGHQPDVMGSDHCPVELHLR